MGAALMQRCTLLANHVLLGEPAAMQRLRPHAGRCMQWDLRDWPEALPALPELSFVVTPAGLLEWCESSPAREPDLTISVDMSNPARTLVQGFADQRPAVAVSGDAGLAADVSWLMDNLRWDVQDDLARIVGQAAAAELARVGASLVAGLREATNTLAGLASRVRGGTEQSGAQSPRAGQQGR